MKNWHPFWHVDMPSPKIGLSMACWHIKLNNWHDFGTLARWHHSSTPPLSFLKGEELTLPKISRKGGMEKLLKGRGDSVGKGGMLLVRVFFLAGVWQM